MPRTSKPDKEALRAHRYAAITTAMTMVTHNALPRFPGRTRKSAPRIDWLDVLALLPSRSLSNSALVQYCLLACGIAIAVAALTPTNHRVATTAARLRFVSHRYGMNTPGT